MKAIHYAIAEWKGSINYTTDGKYCVDTNYVGLYMCDLATGRKNFLFSSSIHVAENLAFAYSLA